MSTQSDKRLAIVCAALTGVTLLSWWLGQKHGTQAFSLNAGITAGVLLIAAFKVRVIVWEFMELRHAPSRLRRIADGYLASITAALLALYLVGQRIPL